MGFLKSYGGFASVSVREEVRGCQISKLKVQRKSKIPTKDIRNLTPHPSPEGVTKLNLGVTPVETGVQSVRKALKDTRFRLEFIPMKIGAGMT